MRRSGDRSGGTPPISTVLFDLGGVVCRFQPERRLAALAAASPLSPEAIHARLWESGFDAACDRGRYSAAEIYQAVCDGIGLRLSYDEFRAAWALAFEPQPEVLALADALAPRARTVLLTNNGPVLLEALPLVFPQVWRRFDPCLFSCDLGAVKPEPALFAAALERLEEPAGRCLLLDDALDAVEAARRVGMRAIQVTAMGGLRHVVLQYLSA